jgi:hypothetical protein
MRGVFKGSEDTDFTDGIDAVIARTAPLHCGKLCGKSKGGMDKCLELLSVAAGTSAG